MNEFINFLDDLHQYDPNLIDVISSGYYTIFESFTDVSKSVLDAYNQLLNITPESIQYKEQGWIEIYSTMDNNPILLRITVGNDMECKAIQPNIIILKISDVWRPLVYRNLDKFTQAISNPEIRYSILHELGHLYEYSKREPENTQEQIDRVAIENNKPNTSESKYHNDRTEKLANYTSTVLYRILDAIKSGITDPQQMYSYVINAIEEDASKDDKDNYKSHMGKAIASLNYTHTRTLHKRIARIISEILKDNKSNIATISKIVSDGLKND